MTSENDVLLDQVLRPSPPMSPWVLFVFLVLVAIINIAIAVYFVLRGAWPITPFLGADVALLGWAFRASAIAARRKEHITLTPSLLRVERLPPKGVGDEIQFNPYWVRDQMDDPPDHWSQLIVRSHGKVLKLGSFLAPCERAAFAQQLRAALRLAREGMTRIAQESGRKANAASAYSAHDEHNFLR